MDHFTHQRHKRLQQLERQRELIVACSPLRSNVNLSRIVRTASCSGVSRLVACGHAKIDPKIARDGINTMRTDVRRSLPPVLRSLRTDGYQLVGLEQTTQSQCLYTFSFTRRTVLVIGNEREGLSPKVLQLLHHVVEIPVYGMPHSFNVATATAMALYEYCRQFPAG